MVVVVGVVQILSENVKKIFIYVCHFHPWPVVVVRKRKKFCFFSVWERMWLGFWCGDWGHEERGWKDSHSLLLRHKSTVGCESFTFLVCDFWLCIYSCWEESLDDHPMSTCLEFNLHVLGQYLSFNMLWFLSEKLRI